MMLEHEQTGVIIVIRAWKMLQKLYFYIQYKTHFSNNPHEYIDLEWLGGRKGSHNRLGKIHNSINDKWYACRSTLWQDQPSVVRFDMLCYPCNTKNDMGTHCNDKMNFCVVFLKANITYTYISKYSSIFCIIIYPAVNGQSHRTISTTWPYNIIRYWYGWYWTVVIAFECSSPPMLSQR